MVLPIAQSTEVIPMVTDCKLVEDCGDGATNTNCYFDTGSLECLQCARTTSDVDQESLLVPDFDFLDSTYGNPLRCKCAPGYNAVEVDCSENAMEDGDCLGFTCEACSGEEVPYSDEFEGCASCGASTTGIDASTGDCSCSNVFEVLVEEDAGDNNNAEKSCTACETGKAIITDADAGMIAGAQYKSDLYYCASCPDPHMSFSGDAGSLSCSCDSGYEIVGETAIGVQSCVPTARMSSIDADDATNFRVVFRHVEIQPGGNAQVPITVSSLLFAHYFANASVGCYFYLGPGASTAACQTLGNLCVLQNFDESSAACEEFIDIESNRDDNDHDIEGWSETLPWLYYETGLAASVRIDETIVQRMSFHANELGYEHRLNFVLSKYTLNGTWLGYEPLSTQLYYCGRPEPDTEHGGGTSRSTKWLKFGYTYYDRFECDLDTLIGKEPIFYELFLIDYGAGGALYPVPILHHMLRDEDGWNVNTDGDQANDKFVHRFTLFDSVSAVDENSQLIDSSNAGQGAHYRVPRVLRYCKKIKLIVKGVKDEPERLYAPILELTYVEREPTTWRNTDKPNYAKKMRVAHVKFQVEYSGDVDRYWEALEALFFTAMVIWVLIFIVRYSNFRARTQSADAALSGVVGASADMGIMDVWRGLLLLSHTFTMIYFPFVVIMCTYWFVFFKLQGTVYILLPPEEPQKWQINTQYYKLESMIITLWTVHTVYMIDLTIRQSFELETFFVDWERPRTDPDQTPVSIWRTILVANEWNKMQAAMSTDMPSSLLLLAFILIGMGLEYHATPQPHIEDRRPGHLNMALRFANTTWWFAWIAFAQYLWRTFISERLVGEPRAQQFVDLCTIAKVSVLVLDAPYHGYYLHCDSPYTHADTTMKKLTEHLRNEENAEASARGLDPNFPQLQTFEIWLTPRWRRQWDNVLRQGGSSGDDDGGAMGGGRGPGFGGVGRGGVAMQGRPPMLGQVLRGSKAPGGRAQRRSALVDRFQRADAMWEVNRFLQRFFKREFAPPHRRELDWAIKVPTFAEKLSGRAPAGLTGGHVILQPDNGWFGAGDSSSANGDYFYTSTMLLGHDVDMLIFAALTYAVYDMWVPQFEGSATVSIILTYISVEILRSFRSFFGERSISDNTLVDDRFLI